MNPKLHLSLFLWIAACIVIGYWLATTFHEFFSGALRLSTKARVLPRPAIFQLARRGQAIRFIIKDSCRNIRLMARTKNGYVQTKYLSK